MRHFIAIILACALAPAAAPAGRANAPVTYPTTRVASETEERFGVVVEDPYRWLENDVRQDGEVRAWVAAQNRTTNAYLAALPNRAAIRARLRALWDFERFSLPQKEGGRYFFTRNSGLQNQNVLYVQDGLTSAPRLLIDPNGWAKDGATALGHWAPSRDGKLLAYMVQEGGSDWRSVRVLDVATGATMPDVIEWVKYSGLEWSADGSGFYYSRYPEPDRGAEYHAPNLNQAVYFHQLGTPQSEDRLIYATPNRPRLTHGAQATDDGRYLLIFSSEGTDDRYEVSIQNLREPGEPRTLIAGLDHSWSLAGSRGDTLYLVTNRDADRYRLVSLNASKPGVAQLRELVAQSPATLRGASLVGDKLILNYLEDAKSAVRVFELDGRPASTVALPGIGSVTGFDGDSDDPETFYIFSSFNTPPTIFRYDAATGISTVYKAPKTAFRPQDYVVRQTFFTSKDGTRVPMFLAHRRNLDPKRTAPTLLYGYGGFNSSATPGYSTPRLAWMEMGGVFALASIRGGGEYGKAWHDGGRLLAKQNGFDDFIAAGEHLIATGVTTPGQLAIQGGSNGGLLVGAVVNQRPDLFAAALPAVGVMDMLRFNRFTAGRFWTDDYGDPAEEAHFRHLHAYSPYHNIRAGKPYPAILVTTADTDDRVVPAHSFKYAAALQAADLGPKPRLIRIEMRAGHGAGKPTDKLIAETADMWAFIAAHARLEVKSGATAGELGERHLRPDQLSRP